MSDPGGGFMGFWLSGVYLVLWVCFLVASLLKAFYGVLARAPGALPLSLGVFLWVLALWVSLVEL